ncbi:MAG TPA: amino acid permease, partial [Jiangellaceae bacterium]|nr:amino acid permease [Jiangellaceae bacterium]
LTEGAGTVGSQMASIVGGGVFVFNLLIVMLILAVLLSITTAMAGSSRTLYQGSVDGWLPRFLSGTNKHGAPTRAMWTDLVFNLVLLLMSDYIFVLACSSVCYMIFNFLNLNAGWIHRVDRPRAHRPWKAPTVLIGIGGVMAFVNAFFLGFGSYVWGPNAIWLGLVGVASVFPFFIYRHYIQDKGKFPETLLGQAADQANVASKRAGVLPYLALAGGAAVVTFGLLLANATV